MSVASSSGAHSSGKSLLCMFANCIASFVIVNPTSCTQIVFVKSRQLDMAQWEDSDQDVISLCFAKLLDRTSRMWSDGHSTRSLLLSHPSFGSIRWGLGFRVEEGWSSRNESMVFLASLFGPSFLKNMFRSFPDLLTQGAGFLFAGREGSLEQQV